MSSEVKGSIPTCTSCHRIISPGTDAIKFSCPNCGDIVIRRCSRCRMFGRPYRCPKCGFAGP